MPANQEAPGVFRLPVHTPFPIGPTNVYAIEGEGLTLFDTGIGAERTWTELVAGLADLGRSPADVRAVLVSHAHIDHQGLAHRFPEAQVLVREPDLHAIQDVSGHGEEQNAVMQSLLASWELPSSYETEMEEVWRLGDWARSVPAAQALDEGPVAGLDGFVALAMPGHTKGLTCLFRARDGLLLSSDHLLPTITPNPAVYTDETPPRSGLPDYLVSLRRLLHLGVRRVLPGHGQPFDFSEERVQDILDHHEERLQSVLSAVENGGPRENGKPGRGPDVSVFEVTAELFHQRDPINLFLALREVFGHLEILVGQGALRVQEYGGLRRYRPR